MRLLMKFARTMAVAAVTFGAGSTLALADADEAIAGRQGCMKAHAASMKVMVPMMKGEAAFDAAAIQAALANEDAKCAGWNDWWGEDTQQGETLKTRAKPEVWTDMEGFEAAGGVWFEAYTAVKAAGTEADFKAAFPALGASCSGCHEKYQAPRG